MPTLDWIGKDKVINHHMDVPFKVLKEQYSFGEENDNMIIHGDNLEALKALLPVYEGKVKCIYIDPPYNTGNEGWIYNDNVNDPKIKKWLGEVVGKEGEDLSRHDKWLCMMYPRLRLIQKLLKEDGILAISIGYHEVHNLTNMCKELFAAKQIVCATVQTSGGKPSAGFNYLHEYIVFVVPQSFSPNPLSWIGGKERSPFEGLTLSTFNKVQRPNQVYPIFIDKASGRFVGVGKSLQEQIEEGTYVGKKEDFEYDYSIAPEGCVAVWPVTAKGKDCVWRQISNRLQADWDKGYIKITPNKGKGNSNLYSVQYLPSGVIAKVESGKLEVTGKEQDAPTLIFGKNETVGGQLPTIWTEKEFFTVNGTNTLKEIFPEVAKVFDYPKPVSLISDIIEATTEPGDIILDSFAGSGTTGHAILNLNKSCEEARRFILIEMGDYANSVTAERCKRVISGYADIEGTGGGFKYFELGEAIFVEDNQLNESIETDEIRKYIWYSETRGNGDYYSVDNKYQLGSYNDIAYYFFYEKNQICVLNHKFLATISEKKDGYVIYADSCSLSEEELIKYGITFKKIPRDISRM